MDRLTLTLIEADLRRTEALFRRGRLYILVLNAVAAVVVVASIAAIALNA